ncbi:MerR family transcriptional regulator [Streptomyces sp. HNM0645]|uniref:MerR family transcriptional regulator n=1 Tax=Streptomyces sp. HNM0645 TaxID=2782343 RepID=UPI0024B63F52|nr:MerR family transcriptional regulator [Streptomyces sp. HNM0645]MDI9888667.1 MerR family transcriptional regulator [Streptomyces sp. HNM0645]
MSPDATLTIGELAERAGVTVKTVRFYSDHGLLPESGRSAGGHRRYGPEALDRLRLIRSLRALDLPVSEVGRVLEGQDGDAPDDVLEDVITGRLQVLGPQLAALRWREASLRLLRDCDSGERAERLRLIGALSVPPGTASMARFWRYWLPPRLPARVVSAFLDQAVPHLPDDPTPAQVWAFARMHALVSGSCSGSVRPQPAVHLPDRGYRPAVLYDGLGEAYALASAELRAGRPPRVGEALDCFVSVYAMSRGTRDTPAFRRLLGRQLAADPRIDVYWQLTAELSTPPGAPPEPNPGSAHDWLCAALDAGTARSAD